MCLIIFAHQFAADLPLVVAANRDEFYTRRSHTVDFWSADGGGPRLLSGRDLQAGGTWLGVSESGRFAAVTNIRDPSQTESKPRSRGALTRDFLAGAASARAHAETLSASFTDYAGYNLLLGDNEALIYVNSLSRLIETLAPGIYGLSNSQLNSDWPKINRGREKLAALLQGPQRAHRLSTDDLLGMMADRQQAADSRLPSTGVPIELERKLSATFINDSERQYGTRCSTGLMRSANGELRFSEQNFNAHGDKTSSHYFEWRSI